MLSKKRRLDKEATISAILLRKEKPSTKMNDPRSFSIPCVIGYLSFEKALAYLGDSINVISYHVVKNLGLGEQKSTRMCISLTDISVRYPWVIVENMLVKVKNLVLFVDFVVLDMEEDVNIPLILGPSLLATSRALINMQKEN